MLPIVLVTLLVSSALAVPVPVSVTQYNVNELPPPADSGRLVNSYITTGAIESVLDGGDANIYILAAQQVLNDLSNSDDAQSQAMAVSQTLALAGELAYGTPGEACEAAALINAYADRVRTGNTAQLRSAVNTYLQRLASNIDVLVALSNNPDSVRYAAGARGNCASGGRQYRFEESWDAILNNSNPYQIGLVNEQYCVARRLYSAFSQRSNNVGAAVSAASIGPITQAVGEAIGPIASFLRAVASGGNPAPLAAAAQQALLSAGSRVQL